MTTTAAARVTRRASRPRFGGLRYIIPTLWAVMIIVPLASMVFTALKSSSDYATNPIGAPRQFMWSNFWRVWTQGDLPNAFLNNAIITIVTVAVVVLIGSLAAYGLTRWIGRTGRVAYIYFILGLVVPFQLGLPSLYKLWVTLGWVDWLGGVIVVQIGAGLPLAIFLFSGFLLSVPLELEEAASIDGAGDIRTFFSIVFPLLRPITATVSILTGIAVWNDLIVSLFFLQSPENLTLPRVLVGYSSLYGTDVPLLFASAIISIAPIAVGFVVLQRFFVAGLTSGALRG